MDGLQVGRIVHVSGEGTDAQCKAAVITGLWREEGQVALFAFPTILNKEGEVLGRVPYDESRTALGGMYLSWHWPERA